MKTKAILLSAVVFTVLASLSLPVTSVYADDPSPYPAGLPWGKGTPWPGAMPLSVGQHWSVPPAPLYTAPMAPMPVPTIVPAQPAYKVPVRPAATLAPVPPPAVASHSGSSPYDALEANGSTRTLGPGATAWFLIGNAAPTSGVQMEVWLDASDVSAIDMAIYAPNQMDNLNGPAVGHGTSNKFAPGRLHWIGGGSNAVPGNWYARVTNGNPYSVQYKVTSDAQQIAPKQCHSYWEYFLNGAHVFWTACN